MNPLINRRFDLIESLLLESPAVISYEIVQRLVAPTEGKLRIRARLFADEFAEFFEYVAVAGENIQVRRYSYHWQDAAGRLRRRWDNAPHFMHLPYAPHHIHLTEETVDAVQTQPDLIMVLQEIEQVVMGR